MARETCCARMVVFALKVTNLLLFTLAFCLCGAASWMWGAFVNEQRHQHGGDAPPSPQGRSPAPWFIFAIAALGASVLLTSVAGLCGACGGSGRNVWLHLYSFLLVLLLLLQLSVSVALFADPKINSRLPPDPTGNQEKLWSLVQRQLTVAKGLGVAVLVLQVVSLLLAWAAQESAQLADGDSDSGDQPHIVPLMAEDREEQEELRALREQGLLRAPPATGLAARPGYIPRGMLQSVTTPLGLLEPFGAGQLRRARAQEGNGATWPAGPDAAEARRCAVM